MVEDNPREPASPEPSPIVMPTRAMRWSDALVLFVGYLILDWASFFHPLHGLNITPWNPAPALGLVFMLRFGWRAAPVVALAIFAGEWWIRDYSVSIASGLLIALLLGTGYGLIGEALRRRFRASEIFAGRRWLGGWFALVVAGTLLNTALFIAALVALGLVPRGEWLQALARFWIGDGVGILVSMPLLWLLSDAGGRAVLWGIARRPETLAIVAAAGGALWIAFGVGPESDFKYFYVLFVPVVWAAARQGLAGAVLMSALIQVGIVIGVNGVDIPAITAFEVQTLTLALAMLSFFVGVVVDEQHRMSAEFRQTLRLAAAGEMAGALAHELNQPLTALSAYGAACETLLARGEPGERLREAVRGMITESMRAGEVVRRLRDFFRTGSTRLEPVRLDEVVASAVVPFVRRASRAGIRFEMQPVPRCTLLADRIQIEVVIRNLLANAFEAVATAGSPAPTVRLSAAVEVPGQVSLRVEDSGPGLSPAVAERLFEPFHSTKSSGLGLGLAISRAIAEAHGGTLTAEMADHGAFALNLPVEGVGSGG